MIRRVASLDIGSNTALMLLAEEVEPGQWRRVADFAEITRISEGLDRAGVLSAEPVARTEAQLRSFVARARDEFAVREFLLTGTAPFRRAGNGAEVARKLAEAVGLNIHIATGEEEAELVRLATRYAFPEARPLVVVDVGGASTELVIDGATASQSFSESFDIGSVRLAERCSAVCSGLAPAAAVSRVAEVVRDVLGAPNHSTRPDLGELVGPVAPLIGVAGTVTTIAMFDLGLTEWDHERVHGHTLVSARVAEVARELFAMPLAERERHPSIDPRRADVLPYGAALLSELMSVLGVGRLISSDYGLRWGRLIRDGRYDEPC